MEDNGAAANTNGDCYDLKSLLTHPGRDFFVCNNGEQVKFDELKGKKIGLYFSGSWCGPCQLFTPELIEVYNELLYNGEFEIIIVSADVHAESFEGYFSKMPWLAIPFSDTETRGQLNELFEVRGIPHLLIFDEKGKLLSTDAVQLILRYGAEGYPFTPERINEVKEQAEEAKKKQSLRSVLVTPSRDYVISNDGKKVPVSELEGKMVGLYFFYPSDGPCLEFTPKLVEVYQQLKEMGESFEVVTVFLSDSNNEDSFKETLGSMPWLSLPFKDRSCQKLVQYFDLEKLPTLVIIGADGKTLHANAAEAIEEHGIQALKSLSPEKLEELAEMEKAKQEAQTLESLLVSGNQNFVIGKDGTKVPVSDLVGKNIILYFSAKGRPDGNFLPKFIDTYHKIKSKDDLFEVIFISSDNDQASFDEYFLKMPWLAIPFDDERNAYLRRKFSVLSNSMVVVIGPNGQTVTSNADNLIRAYGADAYPFTDDRLKEIEAGLEEEAKQWPEKLRHVVHKEHLLVLSRSSYFWCDGCGDVGCHWSYYCEECDSDFHPKCALKGDRGSIMFELLKKVQYLIEILVSKLRMLLFHG